MIGHKDKICEDAGDLYKAASALEYPPKNGWEVAHEGVLPAPVLVAQNADGAPLSHVWLEDSKLAPISTRAQARVVGVSPGGVGPVVVRGSVVAVANS